MKQNERRLHTNKMSTPTQEDEANKQKEYKIIKEYNGEEKETEREKEREKENKLVSVVITVKNSEEWLDQCLGSVMDQSHRPLEVVVFEDCSQVNLQIIFSLLFIIQIFYYLNLFY